MCKAGITVSDITDNSCPSHAPKVNTLARTTTCCAEAVLRVYTVSQLHGQSFPRAEIRGPGTSWETAAVTAASLLHAYPFSGLRRKYAGWSGVGPSTVGPSAP